jgi:hypothetical protein
VAGLRTEFEFTLPKGYVGPDGVLHRHGTIRLATARDEIEPLRDRTIDGPDDPYLTILVLARVITSLGSLPEVGVGEVEGLFAADLAFLQDLYGIINFGDQADVAALQASVLDDDELDDDGSMADEAADEAVDETEAGVDVDDAADAEERTTPVRGRNGRVEEVTARTAS